jgi:hypothetical protein
LSTAEGRRISSMLSFAGVSGVILSSPKLLSYN